VAVSNLMTHPAFQGLTLDGTNTKENVAKFLAGGHILDAEGWVHGPNNSIEPIPEAFTQNKINPRTFILHSNAAPAYTRPERLIMFWRRKDINGEAHFQVDWNKAKQAIPMSRRADCNFKANNFAISFETADNGAKTLPDTPWFLGQLEFMTSVMFLGCVAYNMPCSQAPSWFSGGIDYHSKFKEWSSFTGKTCPGAARIRQMDYVRSKVATKLAEYYKQCGGSCPGT